MSSLYASLADVKAENNADETTVNPVEDRKLMRYLRQASRRFDERLKSSTAMFVPYKGTRTLLLDPRSINSADRTLLLPVPFLSITGVSIGSRVLTVGTNVNAFPTGATPFTALQLSGCVTCSWYDYCTDTPSTYATLTGVWGYHPNYPQAWLSVDALAANIDADDKTLTVVDVDGENDLGEVPRLSAGQVIQIGDEWMDVISTNITDNTLKVVRGVNGSTAASHNTGATVSVFQVDDSVRRAITRQAAFLYARKGAYETRRMDGIATIEYPADLLLEVNNILGMFANM